MDWVEFLGYPRIFDGENYTRMPKLYIFQQVVLGYDCMATKGELAEAVMSILGVPAQHNAPNRDKYIKVNLDNIMLGTDCFSYCFIINKYEIFSTKL